VTTQELETNPGLQRVLWACYKYWIAETLPLEQRMVCYTWVLKAYRARFGGAFPKSRLEHLARLGLLEKAESARGGKRRYYRIRNPDQLSGLLAKWGLN